MRWQLCWGGPMLLAIIFLVLPIFYAVTIEVRRRSRDLQSQDRSQEE
jgi:hypothetical protein